MSDLIVGARRAQKQVAKFKTIWFAQVVAA